MNCNCMNRTLKFLLFFALTAGWVFANGQDDKIKQALVEGSDLKVEQRQVTWIRNDYTAHTIVIHGESKDLEKEFEKFIKGKYKVKFSNAKGWREAPGIIMADIIAETVIFAFSIESESNGSRLRVLMDVGGASVNAREYPQASANLENLLQAFARSFYSSTYSDVIDDEKKELKSIEKDLSKLQKAKKKQEKTKQKAEKEINKLEKSLKKAKDEKAGAEKDISNGAKELQEKEKAVKERNTRIDKLRKSADKMRR